MSAFHSICHLAKPAQAAPQPEVLVVLTLEQLYHAVLIWPLHPSLPMSTSVVSRYSFSEVLLSSTGDWIPLNCLDAFMGSWLTPGVPSFVIARVRTMSHCHAQIGLHVLEVTLGERFTLYSDMSCRHMNKTRSLTYAIAIRLTVYQHIVQMR